MQEFFSKVVPCPVFSCLGNHRVLFGSLVLSHHSRGSDILNEFEDETLYMYRDGLIGLVDTLLYMMIEPMLSLSNNISSLPPIFMSFIP
jgi:hypothetical protein